MEFPLTEMLVLMVGLMFAAVGLGLTKGREPLAAAMMFNLGLFVTAVFGWVDWWMPIVLMIILALLTAWRYAKGGEQWR